jgi:DNA-binding NtrC family response regulator
LFDALIYDGDHLRRERVTSAVAAGGCVCHQSSTLSDLLATAGRLHPDIVIIAFDPGAADDVLLAVATLRASDRRLPVLLVSGDNSPRVVLAALRAGVKDFLEPFDSATLAERVRCCLVAAASRVGRSSVPARRDGREPAFIGVSRSMRAICEYLTRVAERDATVLITGETGTGKELAAARIHDHSPRRRARFVSVNCAAIPESLIESELFGYESGAFTGAVRAREGLLQQGNRGTVFLDEVGDLGLHAQAKILRAIETREVCRLGGKQPEKLDVRIVAATNQDLDRAVEDGRFRKDLYFRLNVARIHVPPLRERRADIVPLLEHYLQNINGRDGHSVEGFSPDAIAALESYDWPGNVRELKNLVEAIFVCPPRGTIGVADLPDDFRRRLQHVCSLPDADRRRVLEALLAAKWNKSKAATLLKCSRMTLYRKMSKYSVVSSDERGAQLSHLLVAAGTRKRPD